MAKKTGVEDRIVPIDEAEPYLKMLVYGENGSGKTRFAASAPNVLLIDINEKGTRSARKFKGAHVFHANKWIDIPEIYWFLSKGNHDFESVALDTLTAMSHMCMTHVLGEEADRDPTKDPAMPTRREWGKLSELVKPMLLNFRNLPMHVVMTAQERTMGDDDEEAQFHTVDMSAANRGVAMGAADVIGRMYQAEVRKASKKTKKEISTWEIRMLVGPHDEYTTKDRTGELKRIVRNPTVATIIEAAGLED